MKRAGSNSATPATKLPVREEWDFRPRPDKDDKQGDWTVGKRFNFLPEPEVWLCWNYEFTRKGPEFPLVLEDRAGIPAPANFAALLAHYWRTDPNGKEGIAPTAVWSHYLWPGWPAESFLSVDPFERKRRYRACWQDNPKGVLPLIPLRDIYRFVVACKAGAEVDPSEHWPGQRLVEMETDVWVLRHPHHREKGLPSEVVAFELDYNLPDDLLVQQFANWLVQRRKQQGYQRPEERGKSQTKQLRAHLRSLGAVRLLDAGLTISEAIAYTEAVSGRSLYADSGDWSKARGVVRKALDLAN